VTDHRQRIPKLLRKDNEKKMHVKTEDRDRIFKKNITHTKNVEVPSCPKTRVKQNINRTGDKEMR
jgi:hypothetical protein